MGTVSCFPAKYLPPTTTWKNKYFLQFLEATNVMGRRKRRDSYTSSCSSSYYSRPQRHAPQRQMMICHDAPEIEYCGPISWVVCLFTGVCCIAMCPLDKRKIGPSRTYYR